MRNPSILSTTSHASPAAPARTPARAGAALFDACQVGVVLRTVMFVEAVVAAAPLFQAPTPSEWRMLLAPVTGGALPATLLWLLAACWLKKLLGRLPRAGQYAAGALLGTVAALYGCGLLRLTGVVGSAPWIASAAAALNSIAKSRSLTASRLFSHTPSMPSVRATSSRSSG
jgi:two-component system sensor histidine kinase AlgZ